ncbi:endonuclease/exonuclease/phosphatase family protein [Clostridia bacterium OttesenSCG-928-F22]|nr:endonuclease/exonuclease/phosphatase family protein [Clostridia bacterium OttesenSCG-928-F22]
MLRLLYRIIKIAGSLLALLILAAVLYIGFLSITKYNPGEIETVAVENNQSGKIQQGTQQTLMTYNLGFGAHTADFSFFAEGGKSSKAASEETVVKNTQQFIQLAKEYNPAFLFFQEVDVDSTRGHFQNQYNTIKNQLNQYSVSFAQDNKVEWIAVPLFDMYGKVDAGVASFSRYQVTEAKRHQLPLDKGWPMNVFVQQPCFLVNRVPVENGRELVLVNFQLSRYDKGGTTHAKQLSMLQAFLEMEYRNGNYVIAGGDFRAELPGTTSAQFASSENRPESVGFVADSFLPDGFLFAVDKDVPSARSTGVPFTKGVNYQMVTDGFLVSQNITVSNVKTVDTQYQYSYHNPVVLQFELQ